MNTLAIFSTMDMMWIFLAILVLFGAKKLPELAKGMGQAVREFNKAKDEIEKELTKPATPEVTAQPAPNKQEYLPPAAAAPAAAPAPKPVENPPTTTTPQV